MEEAGIDLQDVRPQVQKVFEIFVEVYLKLVGFNKEGTDRLDPFFSVLLLISIKVTHISLDGPSRCRSKFV